MTRAAPLQVVDGDLRGRTVLVVGLGKTGFAVTRALVDSGATVLASDSRADLDDDPRVAELRERGVDVELGRHDSALRWLSSCDVVVPSPGVGPDSDILRRAVDAGLPILSEIELGSRWVTSPIVAVTGTNGKTTTCRMIGAILSAAGRDAVVCGNIGHPLVTAARENPDADVFVVEVSSFHLAFCHTFHPAVAVITNFAPDHLDWHGSMEGYLAAKGRIAARQTPSDHLVYPHSQPELADLAPVPGPRKVAFSQDQEPPGDAVWVTDGRILSRTATDIREVGEIGELATLGVPFVDDALAATAAARAMDVPAERIGPTLRAFRPDPHRLELFAEVDGIRFVDDSKATNPHAAVAAIRAFDRVVLIAGGRNKGLGLSDLAAESERVRAVVAFGESAGDVEEVFATTGTIVQRAGDIAQAASAALSLARPGDVVLLSPACSSVDSFRDYAERGTAFQDAIRELLRDHRERAGR